MNRPSGRDPINKRQWAKVLLALVASLPAIIRAVADLVAHITRGSR